MIEKMPGKTIDGVVRVNLNEHRDPRGWFVEAFRAEWLPQADWSRLQMNRSESQAGILRGLHYHRFQVDYWYVVRGRIRVGLADLRASSPTFMRVRTIEMGEGEAAFGLFIPVGVAHGFLSLTDVTLTYVVNNYYDGDDELGIAWNDPTLAVPWGVSAPTVSARDLRLPLWQDVSESQRPK